MAKYVEGAVKVVSLVAAASGGKTLVEGTKDVMEGSYKLLTGKPIEAGVSYVKAASFSKNKYERILAKDVSLVKIMKFK